ncbi:pro-neuregulin-4, membrane-bound isoform isoform X2 [Dipodomys merriami]|uniref:pro-neuregulin-4, membrane-bound isoform isoform X2 n=1 Tax=Dipodomys merriami TaxID=94247 RepID=UPI003855824C
MPTDHEEPCGPGHRSFCLNGGICYVIPTIASPFCRCVENYTGARCEEVFLPSFSVQSKSNVPAGVVALAVLVTVAFAALYFLCRRGHLPRSRWSPCEVSLVEADSASTGHRTQSKPPGMSAVVWDHVTLWPGTGHTHSGDAIHNAAW